MILGFIILDSLYQTLKGRSINRQPRNEIPFIQKILSVVFNRNIFKNQENSTEGQNYLNLTFRGSVTIRCDYELDVAMIETVRHETSTVQSRIPNEVFVCILQLVVFLDFMENGIYAPLQLLVAIRFRLTDTDDMINIK